MSKANYVFPVEVRGTADPSASLGMTKEGRGFHKDWMLDRGVIGLRPTQSDENASVRQPPSMKPLPFPLSSREPVTFLLSQKMIAVDGRCGGRRKRRPAALNKALSLGNGPFPFNNPLLFVIPSEAEGSAVRHSGAPNLPFYKPSPLSSRSEPICRSTLINR
jgi:hypothetical protein